MKIPTVQIVSGETIKPSSPTPPHLRSYKLSWIDQQTPVKHLPVTIFYNVHTPHQQPQTTTTTVEAKIAALKASLSETLSKYYPLAGRQSGNSLVDCADDGVDFYCARADVELSDVLGRDGAGAPDAELESKLMPCGRSCCGSDTGVLLSVQVTGFECGGVAVGVCLSHKIADGRSMGSFLLSSAAAATGSAGDEPDPLFDAADAFPPSDSAVPRREEAAGGEAVPSRPAKDRGSPLGTGTGPDARPGRDRAAVAQPHPRARPGRRAAQGVGGVAPRGHARPDGPAGAGPRLRQPLRVGGGGSGGGGGGGGGRGRGLRRRAGGGARELREEGGRGAREAAAGAGRVHFGVRAGGGSGEEVRRLQGLRPARDQQLAPAAGVRDRLRVGEAGVGRDQPQRQQGRGRPAARARPRPRPHTRSGRECQGRPRGGGLGVAQRGRDGRVRERCRTHFLHGAQFLSQPDV